MNPRELTALLYRFLLALERDPLDIHVRYKAEEFRREIEKREPRLADRAMRKD